MKRYTTNKTVFVWLLSTVLIFPYVVKSAHLYHHGCLDSKCHSHTDACSHTKLPGDSEHSGDSEHDCANCPVCQFAVSFFTETKQIHTPAIVQVSHLRLLSEYKEEILIPFFTANPLRAPPVC